MTGLPAREEIRVRWVELEAGLDPLAIFGAGNDHDRFYWERPASGEAFVGLGRTAALSATGAERFEVIDRGRAAFASRLHIEGEAAPPPGAYWLGGFSFDDEPVRSATWHGFPAARFVLPRMLFVWRDGRCLGAVAGPDGEAAEAMLRAHAERAGEERTDTRNRGAASFDARSDAAPEDYRRRVSAAVEAIRAADDGLEKLVVARSCRMKSRRGFEPVALLGELRRAHPACASFAVGRGPACFLGASPERLIRVEPDGRVATEALAGTRARGRSPEEDASLARALVESKKDQAEHALVVSAIREALGPACVELEVPEAPRIFATSGIQHLQTPFAGRLREPRASLPELAARLHPTPAVGGVPGPAARHWLREHERLDRGWYAAPIGFLGSDGSGELTVALRSALIRGRRAAAWAGAGIVADSDPGDELEETRLKLRTILTPMMEI